MHTLSTPKRTWIRRLVLLAAASALALSPTATAVALPPAAAPATADPIEAGKPTPPVVTGTPPIGSVGQPYRFAYTVTGSPAPFFRIDADNYDDLPPGIRVINSGILTGTPTAGGIFNFVVVASNSAGEVEVPVSMTVWQRPALTDAQALPPILAGEPYEFQFAATGYPKPTFHNTTVLPDGLTLSPDGLLAGTPTTTGPTAFSVQLSNSAGDRTYPFDTTIGERLTITGTPDVARYAQHYRYRFATTGYPTPTVALTRGDLPAGLELSDDGELTGMPTAGGKYTFTVTATNTTGTADLPVTMEVLQHPGITNEYAMPTMRVGQPYTFQFETSGYPKPVFGNGTPMPDGLTLSPDGLLSGTPTTPGRIRYQVRLTNSVDTRVHWFGEDIEQTASVTGTPDAAQAGRPYEYRFTVDGYPAPAVTLTDGILPAGLTLSQDGVLTGTPTKAGTFTFTVTAANSAGATDLPVTLVVSPSPVPAGSAASLNLATSSMDLAHFLVKSAAASVETATGS